MTLQTTFGTRRRVIKRLILNVRKLEACLAHSGLNPLGHCVVAVAALKRTISLLVEKGRFRQAADRESKQHWACSRFGAHARALRGDWANLPARWR